MPEQYPDIGEIREAHEAIVHLVELGVVYAYRSGDPLDPVFISATRLRVEGRSLELPPAELRRVFRELQQLILARRN